MNIVEVSVYPGKAQKHVKTSGVASYVKNLFTGLPRTKKDTIYILSDKLNGTERRYQEDGFFIERIFDRNYKFACQLYRRIRTLQPDVVHFQQELALYGGVYTMYVLQGLLWVLRRTHVPTVITLHHVVDMTRINKQFARANGSKAPVWMVKLAFRTIYRPLCALATGLIVHEQCFKDILIGQYGVPAAKIHVVPHGVEHLTAQPVHSARKQLGLAPQQRVVLSMGYMAGYKDYDLLIEGFAAFAAADPHAYLIIGAGKHPKLAADPAYIQTYRRMQAKARAMIPEGQYRWVGFIPENDIATYYSASDVSVYPYKISMSSSGPMAIAMGYEKPFLGSDVYSAVLPPHVLFERTPAALAAKLQAFFSDQPAYRQLSRQLKRDRLWTTVGRRTMDVYRNVCKEVTHDA